MSPFGGLKEKVVKQVIDLLYSLYYSIVPFVVILSALVFVHELGHYLVARWNGVRVEVFSVGFGPEIFGWNDSHGTRWKISYIPLGGYVKMFSDLNEASHPDFDTIQKMSDEDKEVSLFHKTVGQRIAISAAGPIANYILAIVLFTFLYGLTGYPVETKEVVVGYVAPESAAERAGVNADDLILKVGDQSVASFEELREVLQDKPNTLTTLTVQRKEREVVLEVTTGSRLENGKNVGSLGVSKGKKTEDIPFYLAPWYAVKDTGRMTWGSLTAFGQMLIGERSADGLSGPIGIASIAGTVAQQKSVIELLYLSAFLSISLGLINLFPIPMLDGGHIMFYTIEAIRGRPLSDKMLDVAYKIGFGLVAFLILFSTWNDLSQFKIVKKLMSLLS